MSRRLVVLRHAKSAYPPGLPDHDRPLAPRGIADARAAGQWIGENIGEPDHVVVSSALRARETWTLATGTRGSVQVPGDDAGVPGPLTIDPRIYEARATTLVEVLRELPARVSTAVLVGHQPGVGDLVHLLARESDPDAARLLAVKFPTSGIAVLYVEVAWHELAPGTARLAAFVVPRG